MDPIQIFVIRKDAGWCVKVRETSSHAYPDEMAAIQAAMSEARNLASAGFECEVVMRMLTCPFGPKGMGKAFPTRGWGLSPLGRGPASHDLRSRRPAPIDLGTGGTLRR